MRRCALPICTENIPYAALKYAYPMAIMKADEKYLPWISRNYVYVTGAWKKDSHDVTNYHDYLDGYSFATDRALNNPPVLLQEGYCHKTLIGDKDVFTVLKEIIDIGIYIIVFVDEYYLPNSSCGGRKHFLHEQLVYGYDDGKAVLQCVGLDKRRVFGKIEHTYSDFAQAYEEGLRCTIHGNIGWASANRIILVRKGDVPEVTTAAYIEKIRSYVHFRDKNDKLPHLFCDKENVYVGFQYYDFLLQSCEIEHRDFDIFKHLNHLCEHKHLLLDGLKTINGSIADEYFCSVVNELDSLRISLLVSRRRNCPMRKGEFVAKLVTIMGKDKKLLSEFIDCGGEF